MKFRKVPLLLGVFDGILLRMDGVRQWIDGVPKLIDGVPQKIDAPPRHLGRLPQTSCMLPCQLGGVYLGCVGVNWVGIC